jgi:ribonuclease P protein component
MPGHGFGRDSRLLTAKQYADVFAVRRSLRGAHFVLHFQRNQGGIARLGLVIPKKQARTAVLRNALKRQARELFRRQRPQLPPVDLILRLAKSGDWEGHAGEPLHRRAWREEIQSLFDQIGQLTNPGHIRR